MPHVEDVLDFLRREQDHLEACQGFAAFLLELDAFVERVRANATIAEQLEAMQSDVRTLLDSYAAHDAKLVDELVSHRRLLALNAPVDESSAPDSERMNLPHFDVLAGKKMDRVEAPSWDERSDPAVSAKLIEILAARIPGEDETAAFDPTAKQILADLRRNVRRFREDHTHAWQRFSMRRQTSAGFAWNRLDLVTRQLNPTPNRGLPDPVYWEENHRELIVKPDFLREMVHGNASASNAETQLLQWGIPLLHEDVGRVCEDLRRRIGSVRSRAALLTAYALRCSWYDADGIKRLVESIEDEKQKEDRLSEHLALFLFDNGQRPLTRPTVGRLEPDLFEPMAFTPAFYVEAKQYVDDDGARRAVREGARQIWSTAARIRNRYPLEEAFLVIFRRGGGLLRFAGEARAAGLVVRPVLVDVAPSSESGHAQKKILDVTVEDLRQGSSG